MDKIEFDCWVIWTCRVDGFQSIWINKKYGQWKFEFPDFFFLEFRFFDAVFVLISFSFEIICYFQINFKVFASTQLP